MVLDIAVNVNDDLVEWFRSFCQCGLSIVAQKLRDREILNGQVQCSQDKAGQPDHGKASSIASPTRRAGVALWSAVGSRIKANGKVDNPGHLAECP